MSSPVRLAYRTFVPLSSTHMVPDPLITERLYGRIMGFFAEHLQPGAP